MTADTGTSEGPFDRTRQGRSGDVPASTRLDPGIVRPIDVRRGDGPRLVRLDGRRHLDTDVADGAAALGHDRPAVREELLAGVGLGVIRPAGTPVHERLAVAEDVAREMAA